MLLTGYFVTIVNNQICVYIENLMPPLFYLKKGYQDLNLDIRDLENCQRIFLTKIRQKSL